MINDTTGKPVRVAKALDRAKKKLPYLSTASDAILEAEYTIVLSVRHTEDEFLTELSGASLMLIPAFWREEVSVEATLKDSEENVLGVFDSTREYKYFAQMHMLYVLPFTAPLGYSVDRKMWNRTVRDALFQASRAIAEDRGLDLDATLAAGRSSGGA